MTLRLLKWGNTVAISFKKRQRLISKFGKAVLKVACVAKRKNGSVGHKLQRLAYFFPKSTKARRCNKVKAGRQALAVKQILSKFRLTRRTTNRIIRNYKARLTLYKWQGAVLQAAFSGTTFDKQFWNRYTIIHDKMEAIKKQRAYNNRRRGFANAYRKLVLRAGAVRFTRKGFLRSVFRIPRRLHQGLFSNSARRQKSLLWRRAVLKNTWGLRYLPLKFKFNKKSVHRAKLNNITGFNQKWKKRIWKGFRLNALRKVLPYKNYTVEQLLAVQQQLRNSRGASVKNLAWVDKKLKMLTTPLPWWKQKKVKKNKGVKEAGWQTRPVVKSQRLPVKWNKRRKVKRLDFVTFNSNQHFIWQNKRKLNWVPWYKLPSRRFLAQHSAMIWGGADRGMLVQHYSRLKTRRKGRKPLKRTGLHFLNRVGQFGWKKVCLANKLVGLKLQFLTYTPALDVSQEVGHGLLVKKGGSFSVRKSLKALDFNKFFKVNKAATRNFSDFSIDLYSQYIANLQDGVISNSVVLNQKEGDNKRAARVLRKYVKLLKQYFIEVHDNKVAKKIPASSAMHWIREYLRLTSSIKRRISLWNRFSRVTFHFKPKAKEDDKRGRKKKILFKAKILFDRLFNWLYAQPNARYALAEPIQGGVIRDYIVRNQFIFKKGFKVKLPTK